MNQLDRLVDFISADYSADYWSDVAIDMGISYAEQLSADDWLKLQQMWKGFETHIQQRLAQLAHHAESGVRHANSMLIEMLYADSTDVVETSIDSLRSNTERSLDEVNLNESKKRL